MASNVSATIQAFLLSLLESPLTWPFWIGGFLWPVILVYSGLHGSSTLTEIGGLGLSAETISIAFIIIGIGTAIDVLRGEIRLTLKNPNLKELGFAAILTVFNLNYALVGLKRMNLIQVELTSFLTGYFDVPIIIIYLVPSLAILGIFMQMLSYKPRGYMP